VLAELQRIYREVRRGEIEPYVAGRLAAILKEARTTLEVGDLAKRLEAVEVRLGVRK